MHGRRPRDLLSIPRLPASRVPQAIALTLFLGSLLGVGGAGSVQGQEVSERMDVERVVRTLAALEPTDLQGLEAVVGSLQRDPADPDEAAGPLTRQRVSPGIGLVRVDFAFADGQDPRAVANPSLASYELVALVGEREALDLLKDEMGKPRKIRQEGSQVLEIGRFYLIELDNGGFRLLWYAETPDFAIPPRPRGEEERLIRDLVALVQDGFPRDRIERRLRRLERSPDSGCEVIREDSWELDACPRGAEVFDRIVLRFRPALPGYELVQALGVEEPVVVSSGPTGSAGSTGLARGDRLLADRQDGFPTLRGYAVEARIRDKDLVRMEEPVRGLPAWNPTTALEIERLELDRQPPERR